MSNLTIRGHEAAGFRNDGLQRAASTTVDANTQELITKTVGLVNFSSGNDFTVSLCYKGNDGKSHTLKVTPDDIATLKSIGKATQNSPEPEPIEVLQNGKVIGTINPADILRLP